VGDSPDGPEDEVSDEMIQMVLDEASSGMSDSVVHARREFSTVRTGRASSAIVEKVVVVAYGVEMRMQELASFSIPESRQLLVTPHDPANVPAIEKAIVQADLGLTPGNDGRSVRLSFPELTEERRRDLVRMVNAMAEDGKNRMRGLRRHARKDLDDLEGSVSEDDLKWAGNRLDEMIHGFEAEIDSARQAKENELLEI
jgi:ribosome recycling factor